LDDDIPNEINCTSHTIRTISVKRAFHTIRTISVNRASRLLYGVHLRYIPGTITERFQSVIGSA